MDRINKRRSYIFFSLGFFMLWFLFKLGGIPDVGKSLASTAIDVSVSLSAMFLTVEYLLPAFFYKARYHLFCLTLGATILLGGSAIILCQPLIILHTSIFAYHENMVRYGSHFFYWFWSDLVLGSYILVAFFCLTGVAIRMAFDRMAAARQLHLLEKEKAVTELLMLKHQINPHFIFNTLNTIYYRIEKTNAAARQTVEQFSSLLRYQLYESDSPTVSIENELLFLRNYMAVQRQRFNATCMLEVTGLETLGGFELAPNLLLPIVENCFKHVADLDDGTSFIRIRGEFTAGTFYFYAENSINGWEEPPSPGIGVENLRKRLELLYKDKYTYQHVRSDHTFSTSLSIRIT